MYLFHVKPQLAGANVPGGMPGVKRYSAKCLRLLVHIVHGQEQLTRFVGRLAFMEKA